MSLDILLKDFIFKRKSPFSYFNTFNQTTLPILGKQKMLSSRARLWLIESPHLT